MREKIDEVPRTEYGIWGVKGESLMVRGRGGAPSRYSVGGEESQAKDLWVFLGLICVSGRSRGLKSKNGMSDKGLPTKVQRLISKVEEIPLAVQSAVRCHCGVFVQS